MFKSLEPDRAAGGVFLIALGIIAVLGYWWPGILFAAAAAMITRGAVTGQRWQNLTGALVVIAIGLFFALEDLIPNIHSLWPLALIVLGVFLLFSPGLIRRDHSN